MNCKTLTLTLLSILVAAAHSLCAEIKVGDSLATVLANAGKPNSFMQAGTAKTLIYEDKIITVRGDRVADISIKSPSKRPRSTPEPAPVETSRSKQKTTSAVVLSERKMPSVGLLKPRTVKMPTGHQISLSLPASIGKFRPVDDSGDNLEASGLDNRLLVRLGVIELTGDNRKAPAFIHAESTMHKLETLYDDFEMLFNNTIYKGDSAAHFRYESSMKKNSDTVVRNDWVYVVEDNTLCAVCFAGTRDDSIIIEDTIADMIESIKVSQ